MSNEHLNKVLEHYGIELDSNNKACCPLPDHDEKTPSFTVYDEGQGGWYCHGCASGSSSLDLIMEMESYTQKDFRKAVGTLEDIIGGKLDNRAKVVKTLSKRPEISPLPVSVIKEFKADKVFQDVNYRGIRKETDEFFRVMSELNEKGEVIARYYPETQGKRLNGYTRRLHPKDFKGGHVGTVGTMNDLDGQFKFEGKTHKYILVTGGQEDKNSAFQMLRDYQCSRGQDDFEPIPVVSPTKGENCAKQLARNYDFLDSFDNIIIGIDNDAAGKAALKDIVEVLPKNKVSIVSWSSKDPNQMLKEGKEKQFIRDFYNAKPVVPTSIKTSKDADDEMDVEALREKIPLPPFMKQLQHIMAGGIAMGYIINLGAQTGGGKTTIANEALYYWAFNSPHKVGILSLELNAGQYQTAMLSRHIGKKIDLIETAQEKYEFLNQDWVLEKRRELRENEYGEERYVLLDDRDGSLEGVKAQIDKLIKRHDCKLIFIDPVNDLFEGCSLEEQTAFIKYLKSVIKGGVSIFNICHITKGTTEIDKKTGKRVLRQLTESDFAGVSNIAKSGGCNIFATRDKNAECPIERNTTIIEVPKCRWTGRSGKAGEWYYDNETHTIYDKQDYLNGVTYNTKTFNDDTSESTIVKETTNNISF